MLNKAILIGRLGGDPELRYMPGGQPVTSFSMATSKWHNGQEYTEWHKCVAYGKLADVCSDRLMKGSLIYLEGRIQTRTWETREGEKRNTTEIILTSLKGLTKLRPRNGDGAQDNGPAGPEDDVPF
ncbi:MAG TPA: single-stranded DNA-binding protein [Syntrophales bacterium]|nr:single-stranded DNA-binding protein [Syntrophales bacterium]